MGSAESVARVGCVARAVGLAVEEVAMAVEAAVARLAASLAVEAALVAREIDVCRTAAFGPPRWHMVFERKSAGRIYCHPARCLS